MPDIPLKNATDDQLATAVDENLFAFLRATTHAVPAAELIEGEQHSYYFSELPNAFFKGVWQLKLPEEQIVAIITEVQTWFSARQAKVFSWWLGYQSKPVDIVEHLLAGGFEEDMVAPAMTIDLQEIQSRPLPADLRIVQATTPQHLEDWCSVMMEAFESPRQRAHAWVDVTIHAGVGTAPWQLYVGYLGDKPVANSLGFRGAGVVGLYAIGTLPSVRGQGVGTAITRAPLIDAQQHGYRYGVLFASDEGYPVYEKMGFRDLHFYMRRYLCIAKP